MIAKTNQDPDKESILGERWENRKERTDWEGFSGLMQSGGTWLECYISFSLDIYLFFIL